MSMLRRILSRGLLVLLLLVCVGFSAGAQADGGYSPYSIFGVGDISHTGTAYNKTMGGVGIATRNNRFLNTLNPAAVTARDSLSFMADFSIYGDNKVFRQSGVRSVNNTFNINDFCISFPIWKTTAAMLGVVPFSDTGFGYSFNYTDPDVIGNTGSVSFAAAGTGSIYKVFAAAGVEFFKRLSLGAELDYYFGNLTKAYYTSFNDASYATISNTTDLQVNGIGGKFGLQYEQPLGNRVKLGIGATYSTGAKLNGFYDDLKLSSGTSVDTLYHTTDTLSKGVKIAGELGVGISIKKTNKWMLEFDYTHSDWTDSGVERISGYRTGSSPFATSVSEAYRVGFEYIPNINDIRYYFKKVAYRAGAYYKKEYYLLNGHETTAKGITIGATFPINRWYNGITVGFDIGQRGAINNNLIRETYFNFSIGINMFDIWFQRPQYE